MIKHDYIYVSVPWRESPATGRRAAGPKAAVGRDWGSGAGPAGATAIVPVAAGVGAPTWQSPHLQ